MRASQYWEMRRWAAEAHSPPSHSVGLRGEEDRAAEQCLWREGDGAGLGVDIGVAHKESPIGMSRWNLVDLPESCCREWPCSEEPSSTALRPTACWAVVAGVGCRGYVLFVVEEYAGWRE